MLNRDSVTVLRTLKHMDRAVASSEILKCISGRRKWTLERLDVTLFFLERRGFVSCVVGDDSYYSVCLTYEGLHYNEFQWLEVKKFLFCSVLVPIAVAFITSVLTILISIALQR